MAQKFPYQNLSLTNLSDERWKDIPGFEGLYKISNYGRVKSLSRETVMNSPHGGTYMSQERIRKSKLDVKTNKTINEPLYTLVVTLYLEGITHSFSVARLVYYAFKQKFDLTDKKIYISYKDGDGRNVHIENLVKTDISTIKLESFKKKRAISHLSVLSKPVAQFDSTGRLLANFPSMYQAGKETGMGARNIAEVASGKVHMYKGFFWKTGFHKKDLALNKIKRNTERELVHSSLKKRMKIRKLELDKIPPYLNLSIKSMASERWMDMPGYEGRYQISNFGRVKALQKVSTGKQQKWSPEQIQRIVVDFRLDSSGREVPGSTFACMAKDGGKKLVSIARWVYYLFVEKFDIKDSNFRVYYKDGNSLNVKASNLLLRRGVWSFNKVARSRSAH